MKKLILVLAATLLAAFCCASVTTDTSASATLTLVSGVANTATSYTVTGTNPALVVSILEPGTTGLQIVAGGVTYNGVALTLKSQRIAPTTSGGGGGVMTFWTLVAPATGAHTLSVTSSASETVLVGIASFAGVASIGTATGNASTTTPPGTTSFTRTITGASGDMFVDAGAIDSSLSTLTTEQTATNVNLAGTGYTLAMSTALGSASTTMGYEVSGILRVDWVITAIDLVAVTPAVTYYVSNVATHGTYVIGSDANSGLTPALAKLTIANAISTGKNGDTIIVNPTATVYSEGAVLDINKGVTIESDPAYTTTALKALILGTGATQSIKIDANGITLQDIQTYGNTAADGSGTARTGIVVAAFSPLTLTRVDVLQVTVATQGINTSGTKARTITFTNCTMPVAAAGTSTTSFFFKDGTSATGYTYNIQGCASHAGLIQCQANSGTINITASPVDGARCSSLNAAFGVLDSAVGNTWNITGMDWLYNNPPSGNIVGFSLPTAANTAAYLSITGSSFQVASNTTVGANIFGVRLLGGLTQGTISYNTFTGATSNNYFGIFTQNAAISNLTISGNSGNITGLAAGQDPIRLAVAGPGIVISNNAIASDTTAHQIDIGGDGYPYALANTAYAGAGADDQKLGDVSGNAYIDQTVTYPGATPGTTFNCKTVGTIQMLLKAVGSPNGNVVVEGYSDNAGVPGALLWSSTYIPQCSTLTTSFQMYDCYTDARYAFAASSTVFHIRYHFTGTVDGSNYVVIAGNATGTAVNTSADGTAWSAGSHPTLSRVGFLNQECVDPVVSGNTTNCLYTGGTGPHNILVNCTLGGRIYNNLTYSTATTGSKGGAGIGYIFKLCDGSVMGHPLLCYTNLGSFPNTSAAEALYDKGSKNAFYIQNTSWVPAGGAGFSTYLAEAYDLSTSTFTGVTSTNYNGTPSRSPTVSNNVEVSLGTAAPLLIGSNSNKDYTVTNPTVSNNSYYGPSVTPTFAFVNLGQAGSYVYNASTNPFAGTYSTFAAYQAGTISIGTPLDVLSILGDPRLANDTNPTQPPDFIPLVTSITLNAGVFLSGGPANDYFGAAYLNPPTTGAANPYRRVSANRTAAGARATAGTRATAGARVGVGAG